MNKQKKLKLILSSFKQKQLIKFFESFLETINCKFYKSIKQISFSCYESTCQVENILVNGYGKTSSEALISGINNIIDCLIDQEEYCEIMRQCLRKFNVSPYGLNNRQISKKQLLSTQKAVKTMGAQNPMSVEKKVLTMSASLSSNSKDSSSKAKSIKQEIFQYFNLQNLKVKNPNNSNQSGNQIAGLNGKQAKPSIVSGNFNHSKSKQKYIHNHEKQESRKSMYQQENQLSQVYKKIKQIQDKITRAQNQNQHLKKQLLRKKKHTSHTVHTQGSIGNYFTRPSIQNHKNKPSINPSTTQSNKKLTYIELSIDKITQKKQKLRLQTKNNQQNEENQFEKIDLFNNVNSKEILNAKLAQNQNKYLKEQEKKSLMLNKGNHSNPMKNSIENRKCLVDISNLNNGAQNQMGSSKNQYNTYSSHTPPNMQQNNDFLTATCVNNTKPASTGLYPKRFNQEPGFESDKKLRSFSVNNNLNQKLGSYNTSTKNPISTIVSNLNNSFDNGVAIPAQKKIKIPKLNLEILPNYHGKSSKSLNQSLMENYQKKVQQANSFVNA